MNISTSFALSMLLGGGAAAAQAVIPAPRAEAPPAQAEDVKREMGLVVGVDAAAGKLRIREENGDVRRYSAKKAKVQASEGKILSLADISIGDTVSVSYDMSLKGKEAVEVFRHRRAVKK